MLLLIEIGFFITKSIFGGGMHLTASNNLYVDRLYSNGDLAKEEDCYIQGLNFVSEYENSTSCIRALMLCYSNDAASKTSLGRIKEALEDCLVAATIDPNFLKVQVRVAQMSRRRFLVHYA
ncbi:putative tetratricopeptide-like helical domain superfamily [Helianthus anomalus]